MISATNHNCDECKQERQYLVRVSYRQPYPEDYYGEYPLEMARYDWCLHCLHLKMQDAALFPEMS